MTQLINSEQKYLQTQISIRLAMDPFALNK